MERQGVRRRTLVDILCFLLSILCAMVWICVPTFAADDSVCAKVKIEVRQELTLERQAFDAHMRINNGLSHITLQDVGVVVEFADEDGNPVLASYDPDDPQALFFIKLDSMENIDDVGGNGAVAPSPKTGPSVYNGGAIPG